MGSSLSKKSSSLHSAADDGSCSRVDRLKATRTTRSYVQCMSRASNRFAVQLYQEFARDGRRAGTNFVFSPLNVSVGLGLVCLGAKGATREELYRGLYLHETHSEHRLAAYAAIHWDVTKSTTPKGCVFHSIIHLSAPDGHRITSEYSETCVRYQLTAFRNVDFAKRPDLARRDINKWTQLQSLDRLRDVVPTGVVDRGTKLFLLCALYLRVEWLNAFSSSATTAAKFSPSVKETLRVHMMRQRCDVRVGTSAKLDCDVVELPLSNRHTKFCVLLPRKVDGLARLEARLSREALEAALDATATATVDVFLPRFRYEAGLSLREALERVGICSVFLPGLADLSDMDGTRLLHLSRVFHHIEVEFGEQGGGSPGNGPKAGTPRAGGRAPPDGTSDADARCFRVDRPFIFFIVDERTSAILVIGRVVRPLPA